MNKRADFSKDCKFALLGLTNARVDLPNAGVVLADGTEVLTRFPIELNPRWQSWLGIQASHVQEANLVLVRVAATGFPPEALPISDNTNGELANQAQVIFSMLRLLGTIEYERAFRIMGYVQDGQAVCQNFTTFERYEITRGCLPWMIREENLGAAADLARARSSMLRSFADAEKVRLARGLWALTTALQQHYASDRVHGFVRALEALIYPQIAKTEKQFVHRCSLFAAPSTKKDAAREALTEAYKMRSNVEHVHDWDRSMTNYASADREDVAYWRTRQMETLACMAYARIFTDSALQQNFYSDAALQQFWQKPEHEIRAAFGEVCDITELKLVKKYDGFGRAVLSEWPAGWRETLDRRHEGHSTGSFRALSQNA
jgi:hypothetical protein